MKTRAIEQQDTCRIGIGARLCKRPRVHLSRKGTEVKKAIPFSILSYPQMGGLCNPFNAAHRLDAENERRVFPQSF